MVDPEPVALRERMEVVEVQARSLCIDLSRLSHTMLSDPACAQARPDFERAVKSANDAREALTQAIDLSLRAMATAFADELPGIGGSRP